MKTIFEADPAKISLEKLSARICQKSSGENNISPRNSFTYLLKTPQRIDDANDSTQPNCKLSLHMDPRDFAKHEQTQIVYDTSWTIACQPSREPDWTAGCFKDASFRKKIRRLNSRTGFQYVREQMLPINIIMHICTHLTAYKHYRFSESASFGSQICGRS